MRVPVAAPVAAAVGPDEARSVEERKRKESDARREGEPEGERREEEPEERALRSLSEHLRTVSDRRSAHGKVYDLHGVLCLVVVALLTGHVGFSQTIALAVGHGARRRYNGENRKRRRRQALPCGAASAWLYEIGLLWRGRPTVPGLQQMIRILDGIDPGELQAAGPKTREGN
jgi:hypothetical protein